MGGIVDQYESPKKGLKREILEEIGLDIKPGDLLVCNHVTRRYHEDEIVIFWFDGGVLNQQQIEAIKLQVDEIEEYIFVPEESVMGYLRPEIVDTFDAMKKAYSQNKPQFLDIEK